MLGVFSNGPLWFSLREIFGVLIIFNASPNLAGFGMVRTEYICICIYEYTYGIHFELGFFDSI